MSRGNTPKFYRFEGQQRGLSKNLKYIKKTVTLDKSNSSSIETQNNTRIQTTAPTTVLKSIQEQRQVTEYTVPPPRLSIRSAHQHFL